MGNVYDRPGGRAPWSWLAGIATMALASASGCLSPDEAAPEDGADPFAGLRADGWGPTETTESAGDCPAFAPAVTTAAVAVRGADEISGLAASRRAPSVLWGHNDSGGGNVLFAFSADTGAHLATLVLDGAENKDWEDMAVGPGPIEGVDYLYVADTGDNDRERGHVTIYRVREPDLGDASGQEIVVPEEDVEDLDIEYSDGESHDAEALLVDPTSGDVYIATKSQEGDARTRLFRARAPLEEHGRNEAKLLLDDHDAPALDGRVVGGDVSADGERIVLFFRNGEASLWFRHPRMPLWTAFAFEPCDLPRPDDQLEAVAFEPGTGDILTVPEGSGPPIHRIRLVEEADDF